MDSEIAEFLMGLELEDLISTFLENGITDVDTLRNLMSYEEDSFKLLCPLLGNRLKIKAKLLNRPNILSPSPWSLSEPSSSVLISDEDCRPLSAPSTCSAALCTLISEVVPSTSAVLNLESVTAENEAEESMSVDKEHTQSLLVGNEHNKTHNLSYPGVNALLEQSMVGKALLAIYEIEGELDTTCQSHLCQILTEHFLNLEPFMRLTNANFNQLADDIVAVFPNESKEVYYIPPLLKRNSRDGTSGVAKGKLIDKYKNKLTFLRRAQLLPSRLSNRRQSDVRNSVPAEPSQSIEFLKNNIEPWTEVVQHWEYCRNYRDIFFADPNTELDEIITKFPIILNSSGYSLISLDFKHKLPKSFELLYKNFDIVFHHLLELKNKSLNPGDLILVDILNNESTPEESKRFLMLTLLCSMLPPKHNKKNTKHQLTAQEVRNSLIIHVNVPADIQKVVHKRSERKEPLLPFIIVEGPNYLDLKNVYVSFHKAIYNPPTILKALDICFTLFQILVLKYPYESEHVWLFIQRAVYSLMSEFDTIPTIIDIANKVALRMKSL